MARRSHNIKLLLYEQNHSFLMFPMSPVRLENHSHTETDEEKQLVFHQCFSKFISKRF
jgi:hypothetical protein